MKLKEIIYIKKLTIKFKTPFNFCFRPLVVWAALEEPLLISPILRRWMDFFYNDKISYNKKNIDVYTFLVDKNQIFIFYQFHI